MACLEASYKGSLEGSVRGTTRVWGFRFEGPCACTVQYILRGSYIDMRAEVDTIGVHGPIGIIIRLLF